MQGNQENVTARYGKRRLVDEVVKVRIIGGVLE